MRYPYYNNPMAVFFALILLAAQHSTAAAHVNKCSGGSGATIENIKATSDNKITQFLPGDVIISSERPLKISSTPTATDFWEITDHIASKDTIYIAVARDGVYRSANLNPGLQLLTLRPSLSPENILIYNTAKDALSAGDTSKALLLWASLAEQSSRSGDHATSAWHFLKIAEISARAHAKYEAASWLYRALVEAESSRNSTALARILEQGSDILVRGNDRDKARRYLQRALEIRKATNAYSIAHAIVHLKLGVLSLDERDLEQAYKDYEQALSIAESISPNGLIHADIIDALGGNIAYRRGDLKLAESFRVRALNIRQEIAPRSFYHAKSIGNLALNAFASGDLGRSERLLREALSIQKSISPKSPDVATTLHNLGNIFYARGNFEEAEKLYRDSLAIEEMIGPNSLEVAELLSNLGTVAYSRDDLDMAESLFKRALTIRQQFNLNEFALSSDRIDLGNIALTRGQLSQAETLYRKALAAIEAMAPRSLQHAVAIENMGMIAHRRGDMITARSLFLDVLEIRSFKSPKSLIVAHTLNNLGVIADRSGSFAEAETYHREAIAIREQLAPESLYLADSLLNLGVLTRKRGSLAKAEALFRRALAINEAQMSTLSIAICLQNLGIVYEQRSQLHKAEEYFQKAVEIQQAITPEETHQILALHRLAAVKMRLGKEQEAINLFELAFLTQELQFRHFGGTQEDQIAFSSSIENLYQEYVDALVQAGRTEEALLLQERYRGAVIRRLLRQRDLLDDKDVHPDVAIRLQKLDAEHDRIFRALNAAFNSKMANDKKELGARLLSVRDEMAFIRNELRQSTPKFADLHYPKPLSFREIQRFLDPDTVLLSYTVSESKVHLFIVTPDQPLGSASIAIDGQKLRTDIELFRALIFGAKGGAKLDLHRRTQLALMGEKLFSILLGPAYSQIAKARRILIVSEGPLNSLPWSALSRRDATCRTDYPSCSMYLGEWKAHHVAISATLFSDITRSRTRVATFNYPTLIAFGDPVLSNPQMDQAREPEPDNDGTYSPLLEALSETRAEVEAIAGLFQDKAQTHLGPEASETNAKSIPRTTRIVHFATHATLDERFPLNSAVVLSIPEKFEDGKDNGLLQAWEIFESVRIDADLVVLSACESGLGKEMGGEGLIGLTRAFQYAGARSVMASLWKISDRTTAELMVRFYKHLKEGKPKDEALRAAQMELIRGPIQVKNEKGEIEEIDASAPYYWAAFQIYGDWQ